MVSSARQAVACILLIFGTAIYTQSQTSSTKGLTATISGKVTVKGKGVRGIVVAAMDPAFRGGWERARYRGTTDNSGNYRITNLPAGRYSVTPLARAYVLENEQSTNTLALVAEGETIEDLNFALVRGGVITGRITDSEGQPLIEEFVKLEPLGDLSGNIRAYVGGIQTDDRGIYRVFGLRVGKYRVYVGQSDNSLPGRPRRSYRQTFHPSVTDPAKATVIEVTEGSEISNVDIVITGSNPGGFKVTGRIIDGESGKPLPNISYGVSQSTGDGSSESMSSARSNADGEFRFENVLPGKYAVFIIPPPNSDMRANSVSFEVIDRDLTDLLVKTSKGASLSGVVILEGTDERPVTTKLGELEIYAWVENTKALDHQHAFPAPLNPDGSFTIRGLRSGIAHISFASTHRNGSSDFGIVRVERDGIIQPGGISLKNGEQVAGVRVIVKHFTGTIRGQVKIENGELPPTARVSVWVDHLDANPWISAVRGSVSAPEVDSRGRFLLEGLAAGRYQVNATIFMPGQRYTDAITKQEVTVTDNAVSEVTVTLKLKPGPGNP